MKETRVKGDLGNVIVSRLDGKSLKNDHDPSLVEGFLLLIRSTTAPSNTLVLGLAAPCTLAGLIRTETMLQDPLTESPI